MHKLFVPRADEHGQWLSAVERLLMSTPAGSPHDLQVQSHREALGLYLEQALLKGSDAWINEGFKRWPQHVGVMRRLAEDRSERVAVTRNGTTICLSLFAVPLIFEFDDDVPASQFDARVFPHDSAESITREATRYAPHANCEFSPRAYRLEELRTIPLSAIRQAAFALAQGERTGQPASWPASLFYRRRRSYIRYLIGCYRHNSQSAEHFAPRFEAEATAEQLTTHARQSLNASVRVTVLFDGTYHGSLFAGMWAYQEARVRDVTRSALRAAQAPVEALTEWHGDGPWHELALSFLSADPRVGGRSYVLSSRPGDLPLLSLGRLVNAIRGAGIGCVKHRVGSPEAAPRPPMATPCVRLPI
jgi:hypothetical protein